MVASMAAKVSPPGGISHQFGEGQQDGKKDLASHPPSPGMSRRVPFHKQGCSRRKDKIWFSPCGAPLSDTGTRLMGL
jgi:hypothetical protein